MDIKSVDNLYFLVIILVVVSVIYFLFLSYKETEKVIPEPFEVPAPAALIQKTEPIMLPRKVAPSGPSPPNSTLPDIVARLNDNYDVIPNDPQDEFYGSQDMKDNMRNVDRSFGPGIMNTGKKLLLESEVLSKKILGTAQPIQTFEAEFISNGGMLDGIGPDDTKTNQNYASF